MSPIKRRDLLKGAGYSALFALSGCTSEKSRTQPQTEPMKLRPHHILDIVTDQRKRLANLTRGLLKLGIRNKA